ncbi:P-loop containing nucleoside triphosphate hydrolase protein [Fennellomyces sp. T-0311]|nr:P-loop containing nucleoside triphosphate hydrolase protein [Fennellomyces sp. T-0311]
MAPLKVIGASFGRTGTDSFRIALNKLGYNTHHMRSMHEPNAQPELFTKAYLHPEEPVDWDQIYEGYDAACDWPTVSFLEPLLKKYPDAKVILTVRDPDSWYKSVMNTVYKIHSTMKVHTEGKMKFNAEMIETIVLDGAFGNDDINNAEAMKAKFIEHIAWVKKHVPADRLLVLELGEGWDRLCKFLDKPVPNEPYPHANTTKEFNERVSKVLMEQSAPPVAT